MTACTARGLDEVSFRDEAHVELAGVFSQRSGTISPEFLAENVLEHSARP